MVLKPLTDEEIARWKRHLQSSVQLESNARSLRDEDALRLLDFAERAKKLLGEMEWSASEVGYHDEDTYKACPQCGALRVDGDHKPGCELAALIGKP